MKKIFPLFLICIIALNNFGCTPTNVLATGGATTMVVAEGDRSLGSVIDDATIKINIASKFISSENNLFVDIGTTVLEGRVLLTGLVDNHPYLSVYNKRIGILFNIFYVMLYCFREMTA